MSSAALIRRLKRDRWVVANVRGSHHNFKHPTKPGRVTVPHPRKNLAVWLLRRIYRQAGWEWGDR
ncbi:MAG: type II toxin-antitoxin system HicA family toxin [Bryobacterales bacterium]|nr:type II toxin-antitoxin system HicA family toxin [Bryobacterales bacterium]